MGDCPRGASSLPPPPNLSAPPKPEFKLPRGVFGASFEAFRKSLEPLGSYLEAVFGRGLKRRVEAHIGLDTRKKRVTSVSALNHLADDDAVPNPKRRRGVHTARGIHWLRKSPVTRLSGGSLAEEFTMVEINGIGKITKYAMEVPWVWPLLSPGFAEASTQDDNPQPRGSKSRKVVAVDQGAK